MNITFFDSTSFPGIIVDRENFVFWNYVIIGLIFPILRVVIFFCVGPENSGCDLAFLKTLHFNLHYKPQYVVVLFAFLLSGLFFIRQKRLIVYLGIILLNVFVFFFLEAPFHW